MDCDWIRFEGKSVVQKVEIHESARARRSVLYLVMSTQKSVCGVKISLDLIHFFG